MSTGLVILSINTNSNKKFFTADDNLLQQILAEVRLLNEKVSQEVIARQQSEAAVQANLDIINQSIQSIVNKRKPLNVKELSQKFSLPITERENVVPFEKFLRCDSDYKRDLVIFSIKSVHVLGH